MIARFFPVKTQRSASMVAPAYQGERVTVVATGERITPRTAFLAGEIRVDDRLDHVGFRRVQGAER